MIAKLIDAVGFIRTRIRRVIFVYIQFHGDAIRVTDDGRDYWIRIEPITEDSEDG